MQPADDLCAVVTLRPIAKPLDRQSATMRESPPRLTAALEKSPRFPLHRGPARFAAGGEALFASPTGSGPACLPTGLRLQASLRGNPDGAETMRPLRRFLGGLALADGTGLEVIARSLAVTAAEQSRSRLRALIADRARARPPSFTARAILIARLQNPVAVRPIADATVARFVQRQPSATLAARCIRRAVTARPQTQTARTPRARPASPAPRSHTARPAES